MMSKIGYQQVAEWKIFPRLEEEELEQKEQDYTQKVIGESQNVYTFWLYIHIYNVYVLLNVSLCMTV